MKWRAAPSRKIKSRGNNRDHGADFDHRQHHLHASPKLHAQIVDANYSKESNHRQRLHPGELKMKMARLPNEMVIPVEDPQRRRDRRYQKRAEPHQPGRNRGCGRRRATIECVQPNRNPVAGLKLRLKYAYSPPASGIAAPSSA